jgi:protein TonB
LATHPPGTPAPGEYAGDGALTFRVGGDGALASVAVSTGSGDPELDRRARQILSDAAPFPPPPAGASPEQCTFVVPFEFQ